MSSDDNLTEPGRWVDEDTGLVCYAWPPEGRFSELFEKVKAITTEEERAELVSLLSREMHENSTIVSYMDVGEVIWHDVEPDWANPPRWADGLS